MFTPFRFRPAVLAGALLASIVLVSCKKDDNKPDVPAMKTEVVAHYPTVVLATYEDALAAAQQLDQKARAFVAAPSAAGLEEVKLAWRAARVPYDQTEAFRFYGGPVDANDTGVEGLLNAWPLDENYIDYTRDQPTAGLINNPGQLPAITKAALEALNEQGGEKNISVGYHAIEFLLWGQDTSAAGPGRRPYTDYLTGAAATAPNGDRRGQYLLVCTSLLIDHLQYLVDEWKPNVANNYRARFLALPADSALYRMMRGIGTLSQGELANERLQPALDNQDQEEEHSCFSDYTDLDMQYGALGIRNVLTGSYTRTSGAVINGSGVVDAVILVNSSQAQVLLRAADDAVEKMTAIESPFDQEIMGNDGQPGRQRVRAAVLACREQANQIVQSGRALGITLVF